MLKLSIVIVNYNGVHFLGECLGSIAKYVQVNHEVIVIDNASQDNSVEYLNKKHPEVTIVEAKDNLGFSCGNNIGVNRAVGEYLLLLNNDTQLLTSVDPALELLDDFQDVGAVGCRMQYGDGRLQRSIGKEHTPLSIPISWIPIVPKIPVLSSFTRNVENTSYYNKCHSDVNWVSGAFLLTRKKIWTRLNGLDECFFMYMEDVDYCKRVRSLGYKIAYEPEVSILHYEGAGKSWIGEAAVARTVKSYYLYLKKHYGETPCFFSMTTLGLVFIFRMFLHFLSYLLSPDNDKLAKTRAFGIYGIRCILGRFE